MAAFINEICLIAYLQSLSKKVIQRTQPARYSAIVMSSTVGQSLS